MSTLKVDSIVDGGGSGAPTAPNGLTVGTTAIPTTGPLSNRNLIINGAMQVAQRGTSETGVTTSGYKNACDRYRCNGNNGTWTISQDTDAPEGFSNSFKMLLTATEVLGNIDYWAVEQKIEGQNLQHLKYGTASAQSVTLSFWVKSNVTGTYCANLYQDDGASNYPVTYTIDAADTWEYKTIVYDGNTVTSLDNDNASSLRATFFVVAGSDYTSGATGSRAAYANATFAAGHAVNVGSAVNNYWQITGVQLEVGDTATPFEHRSYGDELARCQRYYLDASDAYLFLDAYQTSGAYSSVYVAFPTTMRAAPSMFVSSTDSSNIQSFVGASVRTTGCRLEMRVSASGGRFYIAGGYYTADAEL